jgi:WD40 repeat protein
MCTTLNLSQQLNIAGFLSVGSALVGLAMSTQIPSGSPLVLTKHEATVNAVAFFHQTRTLASASDDTCIRLWDIDKGKELDTLEPPEGRYLGPEKSKGTVYDPINGRTPPYLTSMVLAPNDQLLVLGAFDNSIRIWSMRTKKQICKMELPPSGPFGKANPVFAVGVSPDGDSIASGSFDGMVRLWSIDTGKLKCTLKGHSDVVYGLAFSPDGKRLASCSYDQTIRIWDSKAANEKVVLKGHAVPVFCVAFSPDGKYLASGGGDVYRAKPVTELILWDAQTGKQIANLEGQAGAIHAISFSPDSRFLASGGGNQYNKLGEVILWDVSKRAESLRLTGHKNLVKAVAFAADGKLLASGGMDGSVRVWDLEKLVGNKMDKKK